MLVEDDSHLGVVEVADQHAVVVVLCHDDPLGVWGVLACDDPLVRLGGASREAGWDDVERADEGVLLPKLICELTQV